MVRCVENPHLKITPFEAAVVYQSLHPEKRVRDLLSIIENRRVETNLLSKMSLSAGNSGAPESRQTDGRRGSKGTKEREEEDKEIREAGARVKRINEKIIEKVENARDLIPRFLDAFEELVKVETITNAIVKMKRYL